MAWEPQSAAPARQQLPRGRLPARLGQNQHPTCGTWLPQLEGQTPPVSNPGMLGKKRAGTVSR